MTLTFKNFLKKNFYNDYFKNFALLFNSLEDNPDKNTNSDLYNQLGTSF